MTMRRVSLPTLEEVDSKINKWPISLEFFFVSTEKLEVDDRYQRGRRLLKVKEIVRDFNAAKFGAIVIASRGDSGKYYIIDGQQRVLAAKQKSIAKVPALVQVMTDSVDEATAYLGLNNGSPVSQMDKFRARIHSKDPNSLELDGIVKSNGFAIGGGDNGISCVSLLSRSFSQYGPSHISLSLRVISEFWPKQSDALRQLFLAGLISYLATPGVREFDFDRAKRGLSSMSALQITQIASSDAIKEGRKTGKGGHWLKIENVSNVMRRLYRGASQSE